MPTLDWLNRAAAFTTAARVPYRLLDQVSVHTPTVQTEPLSNQAHIPPVQAELVEAAPPSTPEPTAPLLVYGEACRLGKERLRQANVTFKHIPYDVRAR